MTTPTPIPLADATLCIGDTIGQIHKAAQATEKRARKDGIALHVIVHPEGFDVKAYRLAP
jgi:DNA polymerase III delta subunit